MITFQSSHSLPTAPYAFACNDQGLATDCLVDASFGPLPQFFNLAEYTRYYGTPQPDREIDILDISYIDVNGVYVPADYSYRDDCAKNHMLTYDPLLAGMQLLLQRLPTRDELDAIGDKAMMLPDGPVPETWKANLDRWVQRYLVVAAVSLVPMLACPLGNLLTAITLGSVGVLPRPEITYLEKLVWPSKK